MIWLVELAAAFDDSAALEAAAEAEGDEGDEGDGKKHRGREGGDGDDQRDDSGLPCQLES